MTAQKAMRQGKGKGEQMAHFYGTLQGNRGQASRCGTKGSGLHIRAGSWQGGIQVDLEYDPATGTNMAYVSQIKWRNGVGVNKVLYSGPVGEVPATSSAPLKIGTVMVTEAQPVIAGLFG